MKIKIQNDLKNINFISNSSLKDQIYKNEGFLFMIFLCDKKNILKPVDVKTRLYQKNEGGNDKNFL